jgi:Zn finger protein HypA/HybF involved in hydrogenase expression
MADIQFTEVTNSTTADNGTGHFDKIMQAMLRHIREEFDEGRIKGTDYATVYLGALQSAMQQAIQFALEEKLREAQIDATVADTAIKQAQSARDLLLKDAQKATELDKLRTAGANRDVLKAQRLLYYRQRDAFDDNRDQKVLEASLNTFGMILSDADLTANVPDNVKDKALVDAMFTAAKATATGTVEPPEIVVVPTI